MGWGAAGHEITSVSMSETAALTPPNGGQQILATSGKYSRSAMCCHYCAFALVPDLAQQNDPQANPVKLQWRRPFSRCSQPSGACDTLHNMAEFDAIFGGGSATTPLFQETSAFRRKDDQYAAAALRDRPAAKQKAPTSALAEAAKPGKKRKAPSVVVSDGGAEPLQATGKHLRNHAKPHAAADAAAGAKHGAEVQQRSKKQKTAVSAPAAAPSKLHAAPDAHHSKARQQERPARAAPDDGDDGAGPTVATAVSGEEVPWHEEDATPAQTAPPPRPVRDNANDSIMIVRS